MKKEMFKKIVPGILLVSFVVVVIVVIGSKPNSNNMENQAQITLEKGFVKGIFTMESFCPYSVIRTKRLISYRKE